MIDTPMTDDNRSILEMVRAACPVLEDVRAITLSMVRSIDVKGYHFVQAIAVDDLGRLIRAVLDDPNVDYGFWYDGNGWVCGTEAGVVHLRILAGMHGILMR